MKRRDRSPDAPRALDPEFARAMQAIEVVPLEEGALPPGPSPKGKKKPLGRRKRRPIRDDEVAAAVAPDEAEVFLRAMAGLGLDEDGRPVANRPVAAPAESRPVVEQPVPGGEAEPASVPARDPVSDDDRQLFAEAMSALEQAPDKDAPTPAPTRATVEGPARGRAVKPRRVRRPKARRLEVDATLDLHRERQARAIERLRDFLVGAASNGSKTVLVITGKGNHSEDGQGILRRAVEAWLIRYGTPWVARFSEAPRALGGRGAWLLDLRT